MGYEISCRFPKALGIQNLGRAGISSHGLGPTFGAGAAAASLLKIPENKIGYVMAYCAQQAAGSFNWRRDEEHIEKSFLFGGMPAKNGALAALLVYRGFTGVPDPFADGDSWLVSTTFIGPDSDLDRQALRDIGIQSELVPWFRTQSSAGPEKGRAKVAKRGHENEQQRRRPTGTASRYRPHPRGISRNAAAENVSPQEGRDGGGATSPREDETV